MPWNKRSPLPLQPLQAQALGCVQVWTLLSPSQGPLSHPPHPPPSTFSCSPNPCPQPTAFTLLPQSHSPLSPPLPSSSNLHLPTPFSYLQSTPPHPCPLLLLPSPLRLLYFQSMPSPAKGVALGATPLPYLPPVLENFLDSLFDPALIS